MTPFSEYHYLLVDIVVNMEICCFLIYWFWEHLGGGVPRRQPKAWQPCPLWEPSLVTPY